MQLSENNYPFDNIFIDSRVQETMLDVLMDYDQKVGEFQFTKQILAQRKLLEEKMKLEYEEIIKKNDEISEEFCTNLLVQIYEYYKQQNLDLFTESQNNISETTIIEKQQIFQDLIKMYFSHARGPFKYKLLAETQTRFTFEFFDQFFKHIQECFTNQIIQQKAQLNETEERLQEVQERLKLSEQEKLEVEEENQKLEDTIKDNVRQLQKLSELQLQDENNTKEIKSLKEKVEKKQQKIYKLQEEQNRSQFGFRKQQEDQSEKDTRFKILQEKLKKYEEMTTSLQNSSNFNSIYKSTQDIQLYLKDFKNYVEQAEFSIARMASIRGSLNSSQSFEIDNIVKKNTKYIEKNRKLKEEIENVKQGERDIFAKERRVLEDQITTLSSEKYDLMQQITRWKLMEQDYNIQMQHIEELKVYIQTLDQRYYATYDYLEDQKKKFEESGEIIFTIRQELVEAKTMCGDQEMLIDQLYHLLPELVLYMRNKQNKLSNCIQNIQPYTNQVEQILRDMGVKI